MQNAHLEFVKVVKATIDPVVEGVLYYITLEASNLGVPQLWMGKVWVKASTDYIELQDFYHVVENKVMEIKENASSFIDYIAKFAVEEYDRETVVFFLFVFFTLQLAHTHSFTAFNIMNAINLSIHLFFTCNTRILILCLLE
ncbi:Cystatin/monellin domain-containing protein [Dioscorea alata]|uniref:Cystatin/monellin domain-containing protein n=1 Tax=Dioscorea alata TaxID=55571 RepID=A0ACB7VWA9_DIOAL|nr:Cystatin/monellin domain-containing protein [Dioscorea alata]